MDVSPTIPDATLKVGGLRFDFAGTRSLLAPGGHVVVPGDILPTES